MILLLKHAGEKLHTKNNSRNSDPLEDWEIISLGLVGHNLQSAELDPCMNRESRARKKKKDKHTHTQQQQQQQWSVLSAWFRLGWFCLLLENS